MIDIVVTVVDLIVQLMICFICLTMGSHENLRKFRLTLDPTTGVPKVMFMPIRESDINTIVESEIEIEEQVNQ